MKEVTRVATIQVTYIYRDVDDGEEDWQVPSKEDEVNYIKDDLLGADDVLVTEIKDFVRDCDEQR